MTVVDTLPAGFTYLSASGQIFGDDLGQHAHLEPGHAGAENATDTITIVGTVTAAAASTITNTATVSSDDQDPNANPADYTVERRDDRRSVRWCLTPTK